MKDFELQVVDADLLFCFEYTYQKYVAELTFYVLKCKVHKDQ